MPASATHRLTPDAPVRLADLPTGSEAFWSGTKDDAGTRFKALRRRFIDMQKRFYAAHDRKLLVVLQAMDAGGKDGTIRNITRGANPQGIRMVSFKVPSKADLARD